MDRLSDAEVQELFDLWGEAPDMVFDSIGEDRMTFDQLCRDMVGVLSELRAYRAREPKLRTLIEMAVSDAPCEFCRFLPCEHAAPEDGIVSAELCMDHILAVFGLEPEADDAAPPQRESDR